MICRITELSNHLTYSGAMQCGSKEVGERVLSLTATGRERGGWVSRCLSPSLPHSVVWLDTACTSCREERGASGFTNRGEGRLIRRLVTQMLEGGLAPQEVGVIAPYSSQVCQEGLSSSSLMYMLWWKVAHLREVLADVEVGTVDQFQGRDKQVIIYSCTRSNQGTPHPQVCLQLGLFTCS